MLEQLTIHNFALIEDVVIGFQKGFNVLTGETGAGKSIILGALNLLMGEKADASVVRTGTDETQISAVISVPENHPLRRWCEDRGVELEDDTILVRRSVRSTGRGAIYVQSIPMTRSDLELIGDALFDMHGQHEHQSLLSPDRQRKVLDAYGGLEELVTRFSELYHHRESIRKQREELLKELAQSKRESDYLQFVAEELRKADLKTGEDEALQEELSVLTQYEVIHDNLELVRDNLRGGGPEGVAGALQNAIQSCRKAAKADPSLSDFASRLESIGYEVQDIYESVRDRLQSMSFSEVRLDELQSRLAFIQRLKKKYGPSLDQVISFRAQTEEKLRRTESSDDDLQALEQHISQLDGRIIEKAAELTRRRKALAEQLQGLVAERLARLGMPHVVFSIAAEERECSAHGVDHIEFRFSANLGEPQRSLREIASGGELSRVMLAIKTVLAETDDVQTLVFDEVDAGIGGTVAIAVGEQMHELSKSRQVVAITHLASIAARADHQLVVTKEVADGRTYTRINQTLGETRVLEIARMLSGDTRQDTAIAHARQLLAGN